MLRIRLSRIGKRKQPSYRIVVADSRAPRAGAFLKIIGHYNPLTDPATLVIQEEQVVHWLEKGAKPSDTAAKLLTRAGLMERAGRAPVRYQGKEVPAAEKRTKGESAAPATEAAPPAKAEAAPPVKAEAAAPAEEEPAPAAETPAPAEEPAAAETPAEGPPAATEANEPEIAPEAATEPESPEPEPTE